MDKSSKKEKQNGKDINEFGGEYSRASMLCFGLGNRHCFLGIREEEQVCSISCLPVFVHISAVVSTSLDIRSDTIRWLVGRSSVMVIDTDTLVDSDVQGLSR